MTVGDGTADIKRGRNEVFDPDFWSGLCGLGGLVACYGGRSRFAHLRRHQGCDERPPLRTEDARSPSQPGIIRRGACRNAPSAPWVVGVPGLGVHATGRLAAGRTADPFRPYFTSSQQLGSRLVVSPLTLVSPVATRFRFEELTKRRVALWFGVSRRTVLNATELPGVEFLRGVPQQSCIRLVQLCVVTGAGFPKPATPVENVVPANTTELLKDLSRRESLPHMRHLRRGRRVAVLPSTGSRLGSL